jgi:hypothetical protein
MTWLTSILMSRSRRWDEIWLRIRRLVFQISRVRRVFRVHAPSSGTPRHQSGNDDNPNPNTLRAHTSKQN